MKTVRNVYFMQNEDSTIWADVGPTPENAVLLDPKDCQFFVDGCGKTFAIRDLASNTLYIAAEDCQRVQ